LRSHQSYHSTASKKSVESSASKASKKAATKKKGSLLHKKSLSSTEIVKNPRKNTQKNDSLSSSRQPTVEESQIGKKLRVKGKGNPQSDWRDASMPVRKIPPKKQIQKSGSNRVLKTESSKLKVEVKKLL
jgi:hypothetical protein